MHNSGLGFLRMRRSEAALHDADTTKTSTQSLDSFVRLLSHVRVFPEATISPSQSASWVWTAVGFYQPQISPQCHKWKMWVEVGEWVSGSLHPFPFLEPDPRLNIVISISTSASTLTSTYRGNNIKKCRSTNSISRANG